MTSLKKFFSSLYNRGLLKTLSSVRSALFYNNSFLNRLKLRFFIYLHNKSYSKITSLARRLNKGNHPKHRILNYGKFFLNNINSEDSVLDIGCHEGYLSESAAKIAKKVIGIDIREKNINLAKNKNNPPNLSFICGDATTYYFSQKFNKIILSNVLEHIENRVDFLKKISRLGDIILIRVPLITRDWLAVYKKENGFEYRLDPTHYIEYTLEELKNELDNSGWKIDSFIVNFGEFLGILSKK
jgi:2-polyprenyl-3-methyl-5-hydroxy-6-metoxy-1,4-benzoquinol methylase